MSPTPAERLDAALDMLALPYGRFSALAEVCRLAAEWKRDPRVAPNTRYSARVRRLVGAVVAACAPTAEDCEKAFYGVWSEDACDLRASLLVRDDAVDGLVRLLGDLRDALRRGAPQPFGVGGAGTPMVGGLDATPPTPDLTFGTDGGVASGHGGLLRGDMTDVGPGSINPSPAVTA